MAVATSPLRESIPRVLLCIQKLKVYSGDPGADLFTSPGDPAFYLHHGQIDRLWTLWYVERPDRSDSQC
jgi:Common central domain of tyrosinase